MKNALCLFLVVVLLLSFFGCAKQEDGLQSNSLFTDAFFSDVVEIRDSTCGQVSGDQMESIIRYLKGLTLVETKEHVVTKNGNGEQLYGPGLITFVKSNGTEITFSRNHVTFSPVDASSEDVSYMIENGNLNDDLKEAFRQALSYSTS